MSREPATRAEQRALARQERTREAAKLRAQGLTHRQIGARLGVTNTTIIKDLDPVRAEAYRALTRDWIARHPERVAAYRAKAEAKRRAARRERRAAA